MAAKSLGGIEPVKYRQSPTSCNTAHSCAWKYLGLVGYSMPVIILTLLKKSIFELTTACLNKLLPAVFVARYFSLQVVQLQTYKYIYVILTQLNLQDDVT